MAEYSSHTNAFIENGKILNSTIDMNGGIIINHEDPINPTDVVNKRYVDNNTSSGSGEITGNIILSGITYAPLIVETSGVFNIKIMATNGGPVAVFSIAKTTPTGTRSYSRIESVAGGGSFERLELRWNSNDSIEVRKTGLNYDGVYKYAYTGITN